MIALHRLIKIWRRGVTVTVAHDPNLRTDLMPASEQDWIELAAFAEHRGHPKMATGYREKAGYACVRPSRF